ncbi:BREX-1 system adenine-specific DNA-methyltransferase PglX [Aliarcobacter cryaerophilus]|uniref:BREX-1 system adenine-specific DNA-methyltransferase PglX n=1 Tax=Aliarcobacter cryaerophilus TaxID=28198 RepID=UPI0021B66F00|nr:BREX-1 system adenine-specific DNA-methyltransferase PglX [Aliarcobacter cryaerophilus]MCT7541781.1 BREX-1 system adenine-specific DNA-methyltransferase PglX [Aliarcobacter cryaerophilus]
MSMFQKSIINSVKQDETKVALRWASFQKFLEKVEYIKTVKEEKYQDGFLVDIFENCLGYTLDMTNPKSFNLEREKKNETDGKKADGVIYVDEKVVGVIELKGQDTKNLDKIETQAFNYHASHSNSKYIIISNFDELRFYVDKKTAYEKFNLFTLNYEEFKKLHLLISYESIKDDIPLKLKEKTNSFEQDISKKLYKDFSNFRTALFENIVKNNLGNEALASSLLNGEALNQQTLLRLTQKLCDRIIFILFAEDRDLLRPNMIKEIREEFINQKFTNYSLYDIYKFYFEAINKGNDKLQIPQYNGGLFATDELLDSLIIDDFILDENVQILSNYDFASEISVNILGHIFEQSLTDLEELQANIENIDFDKTKSKRKKDGVFYTPEYITRYIVENTLGKMCLEKREELQIGSETLVSPSNPKKLTKQEQQTKDNLQEYKNWLLNLKILDPACGSGAFLNQALEYLITEHKNLQNDLALMGDLFASYMVEEEILEHNLYGVDINEDAVEIAKLSLWLRTAKRGRPLTKLADKIVCANSLLEMPFSENSFDVVIGNPPYGAKTSKDEQAKFRKIYKTALFKMDTYSLFIERAFHYLKENGYFSYIVPYTWMTIGQHFELRKFLLERNIYEIVDLPTKIFDDADLDTTILFVQNVNKIEKTINILKLDEEQFKIVNKISIDDILNNKELIINLTLSNQDNKILLKIDKSSLKLDSIFEVSQGYIPYRRSDLIKNYGEEEGNKIVDKRLWHSDYKKTPEFKQEIQGKDINRYEFTESFQYIKYGKWLAGYVLEKFFTSPRILVMEITRGNFYKIKSTYIEKELYNTPSIINIIHPNNDKNYLKFILSCINSKLYSWYHLKRHSKANAETSIPKILVKDIRNLPIPKIDEESQKPFIKLVDEILEAKQKIKDYKPLLDESIKNNNFDREIALKKELENLENICKTNEKTIDQMVYKLYDLTDDEIKIVENN